MGSSKVTSPSPASASTIALLSSSRTRLQDLLADHPHVAGAEGDDDVAVAQLRRERGGDVRAPGHVMRGQVARGAHLVDEAGARDAGDRLLAGGVDVAHRDEIGFVERARELAHQIARTREAMRLERGDDATIFEPGARAG